MKEPISESQLLLLGCFCGGCGCGFAGFLTNPTDVVKIRNQQFGGAKYGSFLRTFQHIWLDEGARGFFKGVKASVLREMTYSAVRMGAYEPIKHGIVDLLCPGDGGEQRMQVQRQQVGNSPLVKWGSSFLSGAIGAALFNPFDLVKVRFQSQLPDKPLPYRGVLHALTAIARDAGTVKALYAGTSATVVRAAFLTSAQLGSYDVAKNNLLVQTLQFKKEELKTHLCASLLASVPAVTASNPPDVVKTRVMNDPLREGGLVHARRILVNEGPMAFMKGWTASYCRVGPHTVISFLAIEKVRQLVGIATY